MKREPDWEALHQINFILANRIGTSLNAALNAIKLSEMPESKVDPQIWRDRAKAAVANVLNLYEAWSALIQYKNGFKLPPNAIRPFPIQSLLDWLTVQMELMPPPRAKNNIQLRGNQASYQEAVLLLYSVGATQGSSVHLNLELTNSGSWFRVRFMRSFPMSESLDDLVTSFRDHWRNQDAAFELKVARDFVLLNESDLILKWDRDARMGEFAFFVPAAVVGIPRRSDLENAPAAQEAESVGHVGTAKIPAAVQAAAAMDTGESIEKQDTPTDRIQTASSLAAGIGETGEASAEKAVQPQGADSAEVKVDEPALQPNGKDEPVSVLEIVGEPPTVKLDKVDVGGAAPEAKPAEAVRSEPLAEKTDSQPRIVAVKLPELEKPARLKTQPIHTIDTGTEGNAR